MSVILRCKLATHNK